MRVGQVRNVAERVEFLGLLRGQRTNTAPVKCRAFTHNRWQRKQKADRLIALFCRLRPAFACEDLGYRAFANRDLLLLESFRPAQCRLTCI